MLFFHPVTFVPNVTSLASQLEKKILISPPFFKVGLVYVYFKPQATHLFTQHFVKKLKAKIRQTRKTSTSFYCTNTSGWNTSSSNAVFSTHILWVYWRVKEVQGMAIFFCYYFSRRKAKDTSFRLQCVVIADSLARYLKLFGGSYVFHLQGRFYLEPSEPLQASNGIALVGWNLNKSFMDVRNCNIKVSAAVLMYV